MTEERSIDRLARYIMIAAGIGIAYAACLYFSSILIYTLIAVVVSLIAKPIVNLLKKIKIHGKCAPDWLLAVTALSLVLLIFISVFTLVIPIVSSIVKGISIANVEDAAKHVSIPLAHLNESLRSTFPKLGADFRIETAMMQDMQKIFDVSAFSSVIGSAASFLSSLGIGLFSVVFISFFFIKDDGLFTNIVTSLVPDRHEKNAAEAIADIGDLLSRYFSGILIEILGVALINFMGLLLIARLGFNASIGIAFLTGIFNIIPYVGPLLGGVIGTTLALVLKYSSTVPIGIDVSFLTFTIILIAIFCFTQLVDNFLYQPVIYSASIKSKPLEIFIVLLIVGHIGGPLGMIVAIPCYTVVRVIAYRFFRQIKPIRRLIPDEKLITSGKRHAENNNTK
ncbi:MAG: AI-2E family transporter [Bacteroidales bacterium]|nr:AI-2E family transporter [Bacteroidales bacterium]